MPQPRREQRVEFLGPQLGAPEAELMKALQPLLERNERVKRAYLARVGFQPDVATSVVLCLTPEGAESTDLVNAVQEIFWNMFSRGSHLDIAFLSAALEEDLARVCPPFYERAEHL